MGDGMNSPSPAAHGPHVGWDAVVIMAWQLGVAVPLFGLYVGASSSWGLWPYGLALLFGARTFAARRDEQTGRRWARRVAAWVGGIHVVAVMLAYVGAALAWPRAV